MQKKNMWACDSIQINHYNLHDILWKMAQVATKKVHEYAPLIVFIGSRQKGKNAFPYKF